MTRTITLADNFPIKGGFTDVGLHTGGRHRNTAWPLFQAAVLVLMEQFNCKKLRERRIISLDTMCRFHLFLSEKAVQSTARVTTETPLVRQQHIDRVMSMLKQAAYLGAEVADLGRDMAEFVERCMACRVRLEQLRACGARAVANSFTIGEADMQRSSLAENLLLPELSLPCLHGVGQTDRQGDIFEAEGKNMGHILTPLMRTAGDLLRCASNSGPTSLQCSLRLMERTLFEWFLQFSKDGQLGHMAATELVQVALRYRQDLQQFRACAGSRYHMQSELRSRETLFVWVVYCLVHAHCARSDDHGKLVKEFGVALSWTKLKHMVLSDKLARDSCLAVCTYLRSNAKTGKELFHLGDQAATFDFALRVGRQDQSILSIWRDEQARRARRVDAHWDKVTLKQKVVDQYRIELETLKREQSRASDNLKLWQTRESEHDDECNERRCNTCSANAGQIRRARNILSTSEASVRSKEQKIRDAEKAPAPLIENLPSTEDSALKVLFFMHMPPLLRELSGVTLLAQKLLLPPHLKHTKSSPLPDLHPYSKWDVTELVTVNHGLQESWQGLYSSLHNYSPSGPAIKDTESGLTLRTSQEAPNNPGPHRIDQMTGRMDGVWFPNGASLKMGCKEDFGGIWTNPFAEIPETVSILCHTEELTTHSEEPEVEQLQWAMAQLCKENGKHESDSRGNWAIVQQDLRPSWLTKQEFLEFGSLRAYPLQQLRKICIAIKSRSLPFSKSAVHVLLKQALFHLGDLQESAQGGDTSLLWKTELLHGEHNDVAGLFCKTMSAEMHALAMELKEKPMEHQGVLLLGELASHLAEYNVAFRSVASECGQIIQEMAARCDQELEKHESDPVLARTFRRKRKLLQLHAIMTFSHSSQIDAVATRDVVRLLAMAQNGDVVEDDESGVSVEVERYTVLARNLVAFNLPAVSKAIEDDPGILTIALQAVVHSAPSVLTWEVFGVKDSRDRSSCFCAWHGKNRYALNVLTGQILFNGNPIRGLPSSVLDNQVYRRSFGKSNFEVREHGQSSRFANTFETTRYIEGRYMYSFAVANDGAVVVEEFDRQLNQTLELLDGVKPSTWGDQLPQRLQKMHSHWYSRELGAVVFRPVNYRLHAVSFLGMICTSRASDIEGDSSVGLVDSELEAHNEAHAPEDEPESDGLCKVFEIPLHLQNDSWRRLMQASSHGKFEHLVLYESPLVGTLSKFEDPAFVHTLASHDEKSFRVSFPRYRLDLVLTEDSFTCKTYDGYDVDSCQQLSDTMFGFKSYLLMRLRDPDNDFEGRSKQLVLVPRGNIIAENGDYTITTSTRCDAELTFFAYEVHPRFHHLQAASLDARLCLAAIYAATSTELPEPRLEMTGAEHAAMLVRQSWTNEPLTSLELESLQQVAKWSYSSPTLSLLCQHLLQSSESLGFLYPGVERKSIDMPKGLTTEELLTCYCRERKACPHHARRALTPHEEHSFLGDLFQSVSLSTRWECAELSLSSEKKSMDADQSELRKCEDQLRCMVQTRAGRSQEPNLPFKLLGWTVRPCTCGLPIGSVDYPSDAKLETNQRMARFRQACSGAIGARMVDELERSCDLHAQEPVHTMSFSLTAIKQRVASLQAYVVQRRTAAEQLLLSLINTVTHTSTGSQTRFQLMQTVNELPAAALGDIAQFAVVDGLIEQFNPLLDDDAVHALKDRSLAWSQWCTLEDRLGSIDAHLSLAMRNPTLKFHREAALQEIRTARTWSVRENPDWLLFEVEGRIRIRPRQLEVARQLLENPGSIVQLNMGEGKTRAILPMMWLCLSRPRDSVVRSHFLPALLPEAKEFMQRRLSASLLCRRVYVMPFSRQVQLNADCMRRMSATLQACQRSGGMLMLAPEHRLSLHLKCRESQQARGPSVGPDAGVLSNVMEHFRMHDIFDESDVLLHHNYQLVYAMGEGTPLPSGSSRWNAAQALLRAFAQHHTLLSDLTESKAATLTLEASEMSSYPRLQLNEGAHLDAAIPRILLELADAVIQNPPREFKWMLLERDANRQRKLLACMTDKSVDATAALAELGMEAPQVEDVLAIRGFLAHRVLLYCLQKRFRVEYGLKRSGQKHLAVPYLAADTPSERSEFQHADCQLVLTTLAYYFDGLEEDEVKTCIDVLLRLGPHARKECYSLWLRTGVDMDGGAKSDLDSSDKLDLSNTNLMQQVYKAFHKNPETINFYLNNVVLPYETTHYPQTLRSSAWDLANKNNANGTCRGFSGTNDLHALLPWQVHQRFTDDPELSGTNGKMVQLLLRNTEFLELPAFSDDRSAAARSAETAVPHEATNEPEWARVLSVCLKRQVDVLIDAGGLMAGVSNRKVAEHLIASPAFPSQFRGITFYCVLSKSWQVLDQDGRCQSKQASPIRTQDTFAFFDDSRCRGADLKLRQEALAVLTVGEKMCKDKLMQAAGRLRQLAAGQRLLFLSTPAVADRIDELRRSAAHSPFPGSKPRGRLSSEDLLCWVMHNTVQAAAEGLVAWADKGSAFFTTTHTPQNAVFNETATLEALYAATRSSQQAAHVVEHAQKVYLGRMEAGLRSDQDQQGPRVSEEARAAVASHLGQILHTVADMGEGLTVERSTLAEECEREVEQEEEVEEEVEERIARAVPHAEIDWEYDSLLQAESAASVRSIKVHSLPKLLQKLTASELQTASDSRCVAWSQTIYCTDNFWFTLRHKASPAGNYLRPVDVVWQFPSGEVLLLSEREADSVLRLLWTNEEPPRCSGGQWRHLAYLQDDADAMQMLLDGAQRMQLSTASCVALQLLNGETTYRGQQRKAALCEMIAGADAEREARWLVQVRGKQMNYPFSDLEDVKFAQMPVPADHEEEEEEEGRARSASRKPSTPATATPTTDASAADTAGFETGVKITQLCSQ